MKRQSSSAILHSLQKVGTVTTSFLLWPLPFLLSPCRHCFHCTFTRPLASLTVLQENMLHFSLPRASFDFGSLETSLGSLNLNKEEAPFNHSVGYIHHDAVPHCSTALFGWTRRSVLWPRWRSHEAFPFIESTLSEKEKPQTKQQNRAFLTPSNYSGRLCLCFTPASLHLIFYSGTSRLFPLTFVFWGRVDAPVGVPDVCQEVAFVQDCW